LLEDFFIAKPNAEMVLSNCLDTLTNKMASVHDRAVSLAWVLHLMGDLHQPLHAANRVSQGHPRGEGLGGNHFVLDLDGKLVNLHMFWDQLPGLDPSYEAIAGLANSLEARPALEHDLTEYRANKSIAAWVQESFRAAVDFAYSEQHIQTVWSEKQSAIKDSGNTIPKVSAEYVASAREIARKRLRLASLRLTEVLQKLW
jgi:hypothetical protein